MVKNSVFNRRITGFYRDGFCCAAAALSSPPPDSPAARQTRGTHNNCGNGYTPWGTYLTTEENFYRLFCSKIKAMT